MFPSEQARADLVETGVHLRLMQLAERGGPNDVDWADVREFQRLLLEEPDAAESLVVKVGKPGQTAKMFNWLVKTLATMAYQPGGIDFMERHFEAKGATGGSVQP